MATVTSLVAFLLVWTLKSTHGNEVVTDFIEDVVRAVSQYMRKFPEVPIADFVSNALLLKLNGTHGKFIGSEGLKLAGKPTLTPHYTGNQRTMIITVPITFPQFRVQYDHYSVAGRLTGNTYVTGTFQVEVKKNKFTLTFDVGHFRNPGKCVMALSNVEVDAFDQTAVNVTGFGDIDRIIERVTEITMDHVKDITLIQQIVRQIFGKQLPKVFRGCEYKQQS